MDYRYETKEEARGFHKRRKAFVIIDNNLEFLPSGSEMSHYEFCLTKGIDKELFNTLIRGYYINGNVVFYKDNFIYDEILISESLKYLDQIAMNILINEFDIYYGLLVNKDFSLDFYYGKYTNGIIIKGSEKYE